MSSTLEIKYFNSFWLKKLTSVVNVSSIGNGGNQSPVYYANAVSSGSVITCTANAGNVFVGQILSYEIVNNGIPIILSSGAGGSVNSYITVASTSGLLSGMSVIVTSGTGAFASLTTVVSVIDSTTFLVSRPPTTALSGATISAVSPAYSNTYSHIITKITFNTPTTSFTLSTPVAVNIPAGTTLSFTGSVSNSMSTQTASLINTSTIQLRTLVNNIGIGQIISYSVGGVYYENTIKNFSGTTLTLKNKIPLTIPIETLITFGVITDLSTLPSMYETENDWAIEEARITGGYNNTSVDFGVKAYIVEDSLNRVTLPSSLIWSGIYNSKTGVNNTNQFSTGEDITKSVTPSEGSIQKLYAEDTNLIIFQENKISRGLIDKNAIYSAEGSPVATTGNIVIGQIQAYAGNYGISRNPESFAVYGYRKYFVDATQNVVCRLSQDGITEISDYGMSAFFRDSFSTPGIKQGFILGMFDTHSQQYVLSAQGDRTGSSQEYTLAFDDDVKGWVSNYSYLPDQGVSVNNDFYTIRYGSIYKHYSQSSGKAVFYGVPYKSTVTSIFNPNVSTSKSFLTINYEGTSNWNLTSLYTESDNCVPISNYILPTNSAQLQDQLFSNSFKKKENKFFGNVLNITSLASGGEVVYGQSMSGIKGFFATGTFSTDNATAVSTNTNLAELYAISAEYVESSY
jgi:hypothetical protein